MIFDVRTGTSASAKELTGRPLVSSGAVTLLTASRVPLLIFPHSTRQAPPTPADDCRKVEAPMEDLQNRIVHD